MMLVHMVPTTERARQPSADDNVWRGEDLKAHLDGQPSITQPICVTPLLYTSELRQKQKTMWRNKNNKFNYVSM